MRSSFLVWFDCHANPPTATWPHRKKAMLLSFLPAIFATDVLTSYGLSVARGSSSLLGLFLPLCVPPWPSLSLEILFLYKIIFFCAPSPGKACGGQFFIFTIRSRSVRISTGRVRRIEEARERPFSIETRFDEGPSAPIPPSVVWITISSGRPQENGRHQLLLRLYQRSFSKFERERQKCSSENRKSSRSPSMTSSSRTRSDAALSPRSSAANAEVNRWPSRSPSRRYVPHPPFLSPIFAFRSFLQSI